MRGSPLGVAAAPAEKEDEDGLDTVVEPLGLKYVSRGTADRRPRVDLSRFVYDDNSQTAKPGAYPRDETRFEKVTEFTTTRDEVSKRDTQTAGRSLTYRVTEVPDEVGAKVGSLMCKLRLRYGALDLLVTPQGDWVFLEINPNGQFGWIEEATGLPISAAIADALEESLQ